MTDPDIRLEETAEGGVYVAIMPDGSTARLDFTKVGENRIIATHTFVPVPYRGEGVGEALALRLFKDARARGLTIRPACWFVRDELDRLSPEWDDVRS
ncbi:MAG: N-acetyltransferase [Rhizobiaceae bacterium]|nr:N-acetyltransferase [Rhizobiaceae bacterium]MCV0408358.1 N-acetyltransferase [Rhizobiaceae bacterium]